MAQTFNALEEEINGVIHEIEGGLLKGHISSRVPHVALNYSTTMGAYTSMCYGLIEKLDVLEAQFHVNAKATGEEKKPSDLAIGKQWKITTEGIRQAFWENRIKRLKILTDTLDKLYYQGRSEEKLINREPKG